MRSSRYSETFDTQFERDYQNLSVLQVNWKIVLIDGGILLFDLALWYAFIVGGFYAAGLIRRSDLIHWLSKALTFFWR